MSYIVIPPAGAVLQANPHPVSSLCLHLPFLPRSNPCYTFSVAMEPWNGDRVTLRAGPVRRQAPECSAGVIPCDDGDDENQLFEYRETFETEYDGVQVFLQEGS